MDRYRIIEVKQSVFADNDAAAERLRGELDAQGRALLPQQLRDFAGLVKNVAVVGCDDHAELWDSEAWAPVHEGETTPEYIAAMMKELNF